MKSITLSADENLIEAARKRARSENTTLNEQFRRWLAEYAGESHRAEDVVSLIRDLQSRIDTGGRRFTRDELNERQEVEP